MIGVGWGGGEGRGEGEERGRGEGEGEGEMRGKRGTVLTRAHRSHCRLQRSWACGVCAEGPLYPAVVVWPDFQSLHRKEVLKAPGTIHPKYIIFRQRKSVFYLELFCTFEPKFHLTTTSPVKHAKQ